MNHQCECKVAVQDVSMNLVLLIRALEQSQHRIKEGQFFTDWKGREVIFSEVSVCSKGRGWTNPPLQADIPLDAQTPCLWRKTPPPPEVDPPSYLLTSSGGHCSGQYASYWNVFLFKNSC